MTELKVFENESFGKVRVLERGNNPWFVAKDVCDILNITNSRDAITELDEDERASVVIAETRAV